MARKASSKTPAAPVAKKRGRPRLYTDAERVQRARDSQARSYETRKARHNETIGVVIGVIDTINTARLSAEGKAKLAEVKELVSSLSVTLK